jgi:hypothetical protein
MKMRQKKGKRMEGILTFIVGWFLVSIPSSLAIGAFFARSRRAAHAERARYGAAMLETNEMPAR